MHLSEEEKETREWLKQRGALSGEPKVGACFERWIQPQQRAKQGWPGFVFDNDQSIADGVKGADSVTTSQCCQGYRCRLELSGDL